MTKTNTVTLVDAKGWRKRVKVKGKITQFIKIPTFSREYTFELEDRKKMVYRETEITFI